MFHVMHPRHGGRLVGVYLLGSRLCFLVFLCSISAGGTLETGGKRGTRGGCVGGSWLARADIIGEITNLGFGRV